MLFNSLAFAIFLPLVLVVFRLLPRALRNSFLLAASYFFYGCWDWRFLGLILLTTTVDFWAGNRIAASPHERVRRQSVLISVCVNLSILAFFKYFNFFLGSAVSMIEWLGFQPSVPTLSIILPVGISFYIFQSMSYTIDIYRKEVQPADNFLHFALYVAYFPQLVAGPISRRRDLLPQLVNPAPVTAERINVGLTLLMIGLCKKVLIADMIAPEVNRIFAEPEAMTAGMLLRGAYLFAFQIYGDFSGYSDMARGISEFFGIRLMINFEQPYLSRSITEFWRRWHISLSTWLRDYLYIPLGGNRFGTTKTYRNLMLTMLIGGLWHGASWTFVAWGGWHGAWLALERFLGIGQGRGEERRSLFHSLISPLQTILVFHIATVGWIFFRADSFSNAFAYLRGLAALPALTDIGILPLAMAIVVLAIDYPQAKSGDHSVFLRAPWWLQSPVYAALCLGILLYGGRDIPFIYFQF